MGSMSIWHWLIVLPIVASIWVIFASLIRLARKAGRSAWMVLLVFVPYIGAAFLLHDIADRLAPKSNTGDHQ